MKGKGGRILLSEGESLWFPVHPRVPTRLCEGCSAEGRYRGQRAALALAFNQSLSGALLVASFQWKVSNGNFAFLNRFISDGLHLAGLC